MAPPSRFDAVIQIRGINPYVRVTAARARALRAGWSKPLPVLVRINGRPATPWRINLMPVGDGSFYLYLHGAVRKAAGAVVGDRVRVDLQFDPAYRNGPQHPMPAWFRKALTQSPKALANWTALIPSRKKEMLRYFSRLKSHEARTRNTDRALFVLAGGRARFMARAWKDGA